MKTFWFILLVAQLVAGLSIANEDYWVTAIIAGLSALYIIAYGKYLKAQREDY